MLIVIAWTLNIYCDCIYNKFYSGNKIMYFLYEFIKNITTNFKIFIL